MPRLLGLTLFIGTALSSMAWSLAHFPEPTVTLAYADTGAPTGLDETAPTDTAPTDTAPTDTAPTDTGDEPSSGPALDTEGTGGGNLLDALARAGFETRDEILEPRGPGLPAGIYRVSDAAGSTTVSETTTVAGKSIGTKPKTVTAANEGKITGKTKSGTTATKTRTATKSKATGSTKTTKTRQPKVLEDVDYTPRTPPYDDGELFVEGNIAPVVPALPRGVIEPGLYATSFETEGCSYELTRVMRDREVAVIGEEFLGTGRLLVDINDIEPDWFASSPLCHQWYRWTPLDLPLSQAPNGDYWLGDLARGVWTVPEGCRWEKVVSFRGGLLQDVQSYGNGPGQLVVDIDTVGLRLRGCNGPMAIDQKATDAWSADVNPGRAAG